MKIFIMFILIVLAIIWTVFWIRYYRSGPWKTISILGVKEFDQGFLATIYVSAIHMSSKFWFDKADVKNVQTPLLGKTMTVRRSALTKKGL